MKLLDKLKGRGDSELLFDALRRAQAERDAARATQDLLEATTAAAAAREAAASAAESEAAAKAIASVASGIDDVPPLPKRPADEWMHLTAATANVRDPHPHRGRGLIALLVVAAILCAAVAWRGLGEPEHPSGLKIDPGLDLTRIEPPGSGPPPRK